MLKQIKLEDLRSQWKKFHKSTTFKEAVGPGKKGRKAYLRLFRTIRVVYQNKSLHTEYSMFSIQPLCGSNSDEKLRTYERRRDY